jgi:hypothetical protein
MRTILLLLLALPLAACWSPKLPQPRPPTPISAGALPPPRAT